LRDKRKSINRRYLQETKEDFKDTMVQGEGERMGWIHPTRLSSSDNQNFLSKKEGLLTIRIMGDILLLYSRIYAWRKVKCVPLNVNLQLLNRKEHINNVLFKKEY